MNKKEIIETLEGRWGAQVLDLHSAIHIKGLNKWNFLNQEIIDLIQSLGTIEMLITSNLEFVVVGEARAQ